MSYGEVSTSEMMAEDRPECPHYEKDSDWQAEMWAGLKTTGYEHRVCRNCGLHIERRPRKELTDIVLPHFMAKESEPNIFDIIGSALLQMDNKRWHEITQDTPQEVQDG